MKNTISLIFCACLLFSATAQNPGYFNRKNVVEFSFNAQSPICANIAGWINDDHFNVVDGTTFKQKKDHFDYGFRFAYMHTAKRNFGLGLEFGYDYFSIQRESRTDYNWNYLNQIFEKTNVSSMMIMPKLEFSNKGSVLPMGIAHQIGLGLRLVKPVDKEYHYIYSTSYNSPGVNDEMVKIEDTYRGKSVRGLTFMYAVNMRTPLSKRLFLNYGLRYTLNFMSKASYSEWDQIDYEDPTIPEAELRNLVRQRKQLSFIQASLGLSFAF